MTPRLNVSTWFGLLQFLSKVVPEEAQSENGADPDQGCAHALVQTPEDSLVLDSFTHTVPHARVHGLFSGLGHRHGLKPNLDCVEGVAGQDGRHAPGPAGEKVFSQFRHFKVTLFCF